MKTKESIKLELVDNSVAISIQPEDSHWIRTRLISVQSASDLSLLLDGGAFHWALHFSIDPGVTLQIENLPYQRAWIGIAQDGPNGRTLLACIEHETIGEIAQSLNRLVLAAKNPPLGISATVTHAVEYCCFDDEGHAEAE